VGILAKENMLRILGVTFIMFLLFPAFASAGFFEEKDTSVQESACSECKSEPINLNPDLKEKVAAIEKTISNSFNKKENTYSNEIVLFIDLINSSSEGAVNALVKFKKDNPTWKVGGVIVGTQKNLKEKLLQKQKLFSKGIEFSIDLSGNLVKESGIYKTPAYVITYDGKQYKFIGQVDLDETISRLDK